MRKITTGVVPASARFGVGMLRVGVLSFGVLGFGVFGLGLLGATPASADPLHVNEHRGAAEFGGGGWTQNSHARSFASGAIVVAKAEATVAHSGHTDFDRRLLLFARDADCLFTPAAPSAGRPWRPGCK
jgi:hypothetical protein